MDDLNPRVGQRGWPPVVVAGAYQTGVVLMRDFFRRGVPACCVEHNPRQPGFKTVYGKTYQCPDSDAEPDAWLDFMVALAGKLGSKPVLIATADQFVTAIAQHETELRKHYLFLEGSVGLQAELGTKQRQYDLARQHGMPVPRSEVANSLADALAFGKDARFPVVLKPIFSREWAELPPGHALHGQKTALALSVEDLGEKYRLAADASPSLVLQEIIEGPDTAKLVFLSCYAHDGARLGSCMLRELRTFPMNFGSASVVEPVSEPEVEALCDSFLRSLGYTGLCEIELKRDSRDGQVKMIEANPRYSGTGDAAQYTGVDVAWLHYLDVIGEQVQPVQVHGRDFRHITLCRDVASLRFYRREGLLSWRALRESYRGPLAFYDFDLRDWRVTADTLKDAAKALLSPMVRRIFPKR